jgi:hypothetical protein
VTEFLPQQHSQRVVSPQYGHRQEHSFMNLPHPSQISSSDNNSSPTIDTIQEQGYVDFGIESQRLT